LRQRTNLRRERRTSTVAREAGLGLGPETSGSPLGSGAFILSLPKGRKLVAANVELPRQFGHVFTAADAAFALNAGLGFRRRATSAAFLISGLLCEASGARRTPRREARFSIAAMSPGETSGAGHTKRLLSPIRKRADPIPWHAWGLGTQIGEPNGGKSVRGGDHFVPRLRVRWRKLSAVM
jgi:CubicO group peptidase (beta-lactamase class C family)